MTNKTTKKTTATNPQQFMPMDLIDMDLYHKLEKSGLKQEQREIVAIFLMTNKLGHSTQARITTLCESGKKGQESIVIMAKWLKTQAQDTATIKTQVNRAMTRLKTGLSLQGLGKDQVPFIGPKQEKRGAGDTTEGEGGDVLTIQYDNDSFDQDAFDHMFTEWDKETQQYFMKHIKTLARK